MGTIVERKRQDGDTAFMVKIILKRKGIIVHRESKTLESKRAAKAWMKQREVELAQPGEIARLNAKQITLKDAIERYIYESGSRSRRRAEQLRRALAHPVAAKPCSDIRTSDLVTMGKSFSTQVAPTSVLSYMSHLASVFALARPAWGYPLDRKEIRDAIFVLRKLGIAGHSRHRDRRPTLDELDRIMTLLRKKPMRRVDAYPSHILVAFAIYSARRQDEICNLRWDDYRGDHILVRGMKDPVRGDINDEWCNLPPEASRIIDAMPRVSDRIFAYGAATLGGAFTSACGILGIENLHFHDLRHEAISRLFEMGKTIPEVAAISGHRTWGNLKRYAHLRQTGDKFAGWQWLDTVCQPEDQAFVIAYSPRRNRKQMVPDERYFAPPDDWQPKEMPEV